MFITNQQRSGCNPAFVDWLGDAAVAFDESIPEVLSYEYVRYIVATLMCR